MCDPPGGSCTARRLPAAAPPAAARCPPPTPASSRTTARCRWAAPDPGTAASRWLRGGPAPCPAAALGSNEEGGGGKVRRCPQSSRRPRSPPAFPIYLPAKGLSEVFLKPLSALCLQIPPPPPPVSLIRSHPDAPRCPLSPNSPLSPHPPAPQSSLLSQSPRGLATGPPQCPPSHLPPKAPCVSHPLTPLVPLKPLYVLCPQCPPGAPHLFTP